MNSKAKIQIFQYFIKKLHYSFIFLKPLYKKKIITKNYFSGCLRSL